jgi:glutamate--cysteine ligase
MPAPEQVLTLGDARQLVADRGFGCAPCPGPDAGLVGIELEWLAVRLDHPTTPAPHETLYAVADAGPHLPGCSRLTFEPGGQVELSSPPRPLDAAIESVTADAAAIGDALARDGIGLLAIGLEPGLRRERVVRNPRYDAMEAYFDACGPDGRVMMRSTASMQVNLDLCDPVVGAARWQAAHDVGPVLAAAFANSPFGECGPSGLRSTRLDVWSRIDRSRTAPVATTCAGDGGRDWAEYALDAHVMLVRGSARRHEPVLAPMRFRDWIAAGHPSGWPTADDLEYHLTTLFPPVRPRGWLELRMIDALPAPWWRVAVAVTTVLVEDESLREHCARIARPTRELWGAAARDALRHPALGHAARACFDGALDALRRRGVDGSTIDTVEEYVDRFVGRGRCPADDLLERWQARGGMVPAPENAPEAAWT